MKLRFSALITALIFAFVCLSGCGAKAPVEEVPSAEATAPAASEAPTATEAPAAPAETEEPFVLDLEKYKAAYAKYAPDDVVMTVNGRDVVWADFFSWAFAAASQLEAQNDISDWNDDFSYAVGTLDDPSYNGYVRFYAFSNAHEMEVINAAAEAAGITLSDAEQTQLDDTLKQYTDYFGGEDAFADYLAERFLRTEYFSYQNRSVLLYNNLYAHYFGENGEKLPEADAVAFAENNGYLYAKHILISTMDENNQPLDAAAAAEKKAEAESIYAELKACSAAELPDKFDSLMKLNSEDPGLISNPDGYYFQAGEMVAEFENAARTLEVNGLSEIVETPYGYHILFRPAMSSAHVMGYDYNMQPYTLRTFASVNLFDAMVGEWYETAEVVPTAIYENFAIGDLFS